MSLEGLPDGVRQFGEFERECLRDYPEVMEILHAAVRDTEQDDRFSVFSDDGFRWISAQDWLGRLGKGRVFDCDCLWRDHIAETDIDLDGQSCPGDGCAGSDAHTGTFVFAPDLSGYDACNFEDDPIVRHLHGTDGADACCSHGGIGTAMTQKTGVAGRSEGIAVPAGEEHGTLQDVPFALIGDAAMIDLIIVSAASATCTLDWHVLVKRNTPVPRK